MAERIRRASEDLLRISDRVRELQSVTTADGCVLEPVGPCSSLRQVIDGLRSR